jgi:tetratricopeptide (TPR) repeat protein
MESRSRADELNLQGTARLSKGDLAGAIADYGDALRVSPRQHAARIYYNRGTARHLAGDIRGALDDFDQAIAISSDFAEAYNNRGMTRQLQGNLPGALADFEQAIVISPAYAEAYNNRGTARSAGGDRSGALADFSRAIELDPRHYRAHNNRAIVLQSQGDLSGALADFNRAIALHPSYAEAYGNRGIARQEIAHQRNPIRPRAFIDHDLPAPVRSDMADVIADFDRAVELTPRPAAAPAYHNRGAARQLQGDLAGALADFNEALAIDPAHSPTYANRGTAHKALGDLTAARADLDRAVELTPRATAAAAYHNRGGVRVLQNDFAGAVADYNIALEIDPDLTVAYLSRGNARYHLREPGAFLDHRHALLTAPALAVEEMLHMFVDDLKKDPAALLRNCEKHLRINRGDVTAMLRRGVALLVLHRDLEQARLDLARGFELAPEMKQPLTPLVDAAAAYGAAAARNLSTVREIVNGTTPH